MHNFARVKVHESEDPRVNRRLSEEPRVSRSLLSKRISTRSLPRPCVDRYCLGYFLNGESRGSSPLSKENGSPFSFIKKTPFPEISNKFNEKT